MNVYIIVEGDKTELSVYPAWLNHLVPSLKRVSHKDDLIENNYYLFSGHGIPSIYNHVCNAVEDINELNSYGAGRVDYLIVCVDTEEESREHILQKINEHLDKRNVSLVSPCKLEVFEHKVSMETWFLGNGKLLRPNMQSVTLQRYRRFYDIGNDDPEMMENIDSERFSTKAQFHYSYLKELFRENRMIYSKRNTAEVCEPLYLNRLIERYNKSGHIRSFGRWYEFMTTELLPKISPLFKPGSLSCMK